MSVKGHQTVPTTAPILPAATSALASPAIGLKKMAEDVQTSTSASLLLASNSVPTTLAAMSVAADQAISLRQTGHLATVIIQYINHHY